VLHHVLFVSPAVEIRALDYTPIALKPRPHQIHCDINELVHQHLDRSGTIDLAEAAARIAESLVDLIVLAPKPQ
jgi:hypothetical protein